MHGTAGSSALTLLVLSTISSTTQALLYIVIFGIGSIAGMLFISVLIAAPIHWVDHHRNDAIRPASLECL